MSPQGKLEESRGKKIPCRLNPCKRTFSKERFRNSHESWHRKELDVEGDLSTVKLADIRIGPDGKGKIRISKKERVRREQVLKEAEAIGEASGDFMNLLSLFNQELNKVGEMFGEVKIAFEAKTIRLAKELESLRKTRREILAIRDMVKDW